MKNINKYFEFSILFCIYWRELYYDELRRNCYNWMWWMKDTLWTIRVYDTYLTAVVIDVAKV